MSKLSDCLGKAVASGLMTEAEASFALGRSKEFAGQGQERKDAEMSAVRSLMTDALGDLDTIRAQLGFAPRENNILFRTRNAEAANNAYVDASQRAMEERLIRQQQGEGAVEEAQELAEEEMLGPRPGTAEALQFAPAEVTSPEREESIRSLERSLRLPEAALAEVRLRDTEPASQAVSDFAAAWQNLTGREVVFVEQREAGAAAAFAGAVDPAQPGKIFLNARGNRALVALAGHEWAHTLASSNPALFQEMGAKLRPLITEWQQRTGELAGYAAEIADEELVANIVGDAFNNPEFWELVKERDRSLWQRIVEAINNWFDELIGRAAESEWGTENFISDLRAVHEAILDTVDAEGTIERPAAAEGTPARLATQRGKGAAKELSAEHAMKNERQTRAVALKTLVSAEEKAAIAAEDRRLRQAARRNTSSRPKADARGQRQELSGEQARLRRRPGLDAAGGDRGEVGRPRRTRMGSGKAHPGGREVGRCGL